MSTTPTPRSSGDTGPVSPGGVQSVHRTFDLLEVLVASGGALPLAEIAASAGLPLPTAHRLLRTLVERGYLRQLPNRSYALGFRLVPLGAAANALVGPAAQSVLRDLVAELGETANLAALSGNQAEYVAQAPARYSMRMFTEVGRRVDLHATGVGKAMLAQFDDSQVAQIVGTSGLPAYTEHTVTTHTGLLAALERVRRDGYALDEQEQEIGVRCVAVPIDAGVQSWMAISVSGPLSRMTDEAVTKAVPLLQSAAARLAKDLTGASSTA